MKDIILLLIVALLLIWSYILLPKIVKGKIMEEVSRDNGLDVNIKWLSPKSCLFLVEYTVGGNTIRKNVKYNLLASVEWI